MASKQSINGQFTVSRVLMYLCQGLLSIAAFFLWNMIQEMRVDIAALKASMAAKETHVAELKLKTTVTDEYVKEIKSDIKLINNAVQDMRILLQGRKQ